MDARLCDRLNELIALDLDAAATYEVAVTHVKHTRLRGTLLGFAAEHRRQAEALAVCVERLGGRPVMQRDGRGIVLAGFARVTSLLGTEAALRALQALEKLTDAAYRSARHESWTIGERSAIEQHLRHEEAHLRFVEEALHGRVWEQDEPARP